MILRIPAVAAAFSIALAVPASGQAPSAPSVNLVTVQQIVGSWSYQAISGGSQAAFKDSSGSVRLTVRCLRSNRLVTLTRTAVPAAAPAMTVTTTFGSRALPSAYDSAHNLSASMQAADPLLDDIVFSRGRFAISNGGSSPLVVPVWGEIARIVEDCRN